VAAKPTVRRSTSRYAGSLSEQDLVASCTQRLDRNARTSPAPSPRDSMVAGRKRNAWPSTAGGRLAACLADRTVPTRPPPTVWRRQPELASRDAHPCLCGRHQSRVRFRPRRRRTVSLRWLGERVARCRPSPGRSPL